MFVSIFISVCLIVVFIFYRQHVQEKRVKYFKDRGIVMQKSEFFIKELCTVLTNNITLLINQMYEKYKSERIIGFFNSGIPQCFVLDPVIIKQITVKDFDHFVDHLSFLDFDHDPFFGNTLISLKGKRWRDMRSSLSPAFTGSKMRSMFQLVQQCSQQMAQYFLEQCNQNGPHSYDMKDIYSKFTNDVIASCAFGLKCDTFREPENEFFKIGKKVANFQSPWNLFKLIIYRMIPLRNVAKLLDVKLLDDKSRNTFTKMIFAAMKTREERKIFRPDMINLLMELKKGQLQASAEIEANKSIAAVDEHINLSTEPNQTWTDDELISQCFIFFLAGFDTSSTLMTFTAYELALNLNVQTKVLEEIDRINIDLAGKPLDYDHLQSMTYMDMVITETLRKWPPVVITDRLCIRDYNYQGEDGFQFRIEKGTDLLIPIYSLQRDPEYFPEPDKFHPERFSSDSKSSVNLGVYIPFGIGPRNCIGSRFALMETKSIIYHLLLNFTFDLCQKTQIPIKLKNTMGGVLPDKAEILLRPRH